MADGKQPIKLRFKDDVTSPTLELGHGQYNRKFDAKDQPFEMSGYAVKELDDAGKETGAEIVIVTPEEEAKILLATGHFVEDGKEQSAGSVPGAVATGSSEATPKKEAGKMPALQSQGKIGGAPASGEEQSAKS